jgi:hypothetical protein
MSMKRPRASRPAGPTLAPVIVAIALAGCGDENGETTEVPGPRFITAEQIREEAHAKDSPERTALEWWRAAQFGNAPTLLRYYNPALELTIEELSDQLASGSIAFAGFPAIESTDEDGVEATVYIVLDPPDSGASERTVSINLVQVDGEWKLADNLLLEQAVKRIRAARRAAGD